MYSVMMFLSAVAAYLFFRNRTMLKHEKSFTHIITYLLSPRLVAGNARPCGWSGCSLTLVQSYDVLSPWSRQHTAFTDQIGPLRVVLPYLKCFSSLGWASSRCVSITPRNSNALEDNALFPVLLQRRPITSNTPNYPRQKVVMVLFRRPSCALFGLLMKCSPDLSLARRVGMRLRPRAGTWATFCSVTTVMPPDCCSSSLNLPYP